MILNFINLSNLLMMHKSNMQQKIPGTCKKKCYYLLPFLSMYISVLGPHVTYITSHIIRRNPFISVPITHLRISILAPCMHAHEGGIRNKAMDFLFKYIHTYMYHVSTCIWLGLALAEKERKNSMPVSPSPTNTITLYT